MLSRFIERKIFQKSAPRRINYVTPVAQHKAVGVVAEVYHQMEQDFQVVPPLTLHSSHPKLLAAVWAISRESVIAGPVDRTYRETIAAGVSKINECPFCVEIHTAMLHGGNEHGMAQALLHGDLNNIPSSEIRDMAEWAIATRTPDAQILQSPPFSKEDAPVLIGTAIVFHYLDRMVNLFLDKSPLPVKSMPKWLKGTMGRVAGRLFGKRIIGLTVKHGDALLASREIELPTEFSWARYNPFVATAFSQFTKTLDDIGETFVSKEVRELVKQHVDSWNGEDIGFNQTWIEEAVATLSENEKVAGRLALLTALASYQVDEELIKSFQKQFPADEQIIGLTAWASYIACRRIASWLHKSPEDATHHETNHQQKVNCQ